MATAATPKPKFTREVQRGLRLYVYQTYEISPRQSLADVSLEQGDTITFNSQTYEILTADDDFDPKSGKKIVEIVADRMIAWS